MHVPAYTSMYSICCHLLMVVLPSTHSVPSLPSLLGSNKQVITEDDKWETLKAEGKGIVFRDQLPILCHSSPV